MSDAFWDWYDTGKKNGWCSEMVCDTHDGLPMSEEEMNDWFEGEDYCIVAVRIYGTERVDND